MNNHGANLYELSQSLGLNKTNIIDFSSNINPFGLSPKATEVLRNNIDLASIYPDPEYHELKKSISEYCKCYPKNIILGSGATELISATIKTVLPKKALLLSPAYSEYEKELNKINCQITKLFYKKENNFQIDIDHLLSLINENDFDIIVICNPNNPTGSLISLDYLKIISSAFNKTIMIDETYIEFTNFEKTSAISLAIENENIIVIRGTSKFFSTPGIRLGYAILSEGKLFSKMNSLPNLWNINIFASLMGENMFKDTEYLTMCHKKFDENFSLLFSGLKSFNEIKVYESQSNFILCEIINSNFTVDNLYNYLAEKGIIIRKAESFEGLDKNFFRVCVLSREHIEILLKEMKYFFNIKED